MKISLLIIFLINSAFANICKFGVHPFNEESLEYCDASSFKDGEVLIRYEYQILPEHIDIIENFPRDRFPDGETFRDTVKRSKLEVVWYVSNGLPVKGYIASPRKRSKSRLPVIIYNRGGNPSLGYFFDNTAYRHLGILAKEGFVVVASNYRGARDIDLSIPSRINYSPGEDEFGGSDVNDVKNIITVAENLNIANKDKMILLGESRGGVMNTGVLTDPTVSNRFVGSVFLWALTDCPKTAKDREIMDELFRDLIPYNSEEEYSKELSKRSAISRFKEFPNTSYYLAHGLADTRVGANQSINLEASLKSEGHKVEAKYYEGANHGITNVHFWDYMNNFIKLVEKNH